MSTSTGWYTWQNPSELLLFVLATSLSCLLSLFGLLASPATSVRCAGCCATWLFPGYLLLLVPHHQAQDLRAPPIQIKVPVFLGVAPRHLEVYFSFLLLLWFEKYSLLLDFCFLRAQQVSFTITLRYLICYISGQFQVLSRAFSNHHVDIPGDFMNPKPGKRIKYLVVALESPFAHKLLQMFQL